MASRRLINSVCIVVLAITGSLTIAVPVDVGSGDNSAGLYIEWGDGYVVEFLVRFEDATVSGLGLFDIVEAETTLTTVREDFGWGILIDGISYDGHSDAGFGGGEDWWHYWIKNAGQTEWMSPAYGAVDRTLADGDSDGWIYGRAGAVPEPATVALLSLGALLVLKRKRETNGHRKD